MYYFSKEKRERAEREAFSQKKKRNNQVVKCNISVAQIAINIIGIKFQKVAATFHRGCKFFNYKILEEQTNITVS